jgi:hypothetical protein
LTGALAIIGIFELSLLVVVSAAILMVLLMIATQLGARMKCRDVWALYNELVLSQRNSLVWYVSNAMHGFNPPSYQLVLAESFYDEGRTLHTELAKLVAIAEEEARTDIVTEIQNQLEEWEVVLNQLRNRIDELDVKHRL